MIVGFSSLIPSLLEGRYEVIFSGPMSSLDVSEYASVRRRSQSFDDSLFLIVTVPNGIVDEKIEVTVEGQLAGSFTKTGGDMFPPPVPYGLTRSICQNTGLYDLHELMADQFVTYKTSSKAYELVQKKLNDELEKRSGGLFVPEGHLSTSPPKRTGVGSADVAQKYVYVISNSAYSGEYKVDIAKNWKARLNTYQTADPHRGYELEYKLEALHFRAIEQHIHEAFDNKHEWVQGDLQRSGMRSCSTISG